MIDNLTGLGYGIVTFAVVIGVGVVVLSKFGSTMLGCPTDASGYLYVENTTATGLYGKSASTACYNATNTETVSSMVDTSGTKANITTNYLSGQLGSSGLAGWTPAIIALTIGMLFLGMFLAKKGRKY